MEIISFNKSYIDNVKELLSVEEIDPSTLQSYNLELFENDYFQSFICLNEGEVVASISLSIRLYVLEINHIFVKNDYRGKGIAKKLINKAFEFAKENDCESVLVNTAESNEAAKKLYEKLGFKQAGKVFDYFNNNQKQVFYIKKKF